MRSIVKLIKQLKSDEDGAPLIEYTVLLAILLVAVIAIIAAIGTWINGQWASLNNAI
jgi:pilus assembly protein Flp/PilA